MSCQFSCSLKNGSYECIVPQDGPCADTPGYVAGEKESFRTSHAIHQSISNVACIGIIGILILIVIIFIIRPGK